LNCIPNSEEKEKTFHSEKRKEKKKLKGKETPQRQRHTTV